MREPETLGHLSCGTAVLELTVLQYGTISDLTLVNTLIRCTET